MKLFYIFLILIFISIIISVFNKYLIEYFKVEYTKKEFDKMILNKKSYDLYNLSLGDKVKIQRENCFKKCDYENCVKLYNMRENYRKCNNCQMDKDKCFKDLITYGGCDDCSENVPKNKCSSLTKYGCPDFNNIFSNKGVEPYFIDLLDNFVGSAVRGFIKGFSSVGG